MTKEIFLWEDKTIEQTNPLPNPPINSPSSNKNVLIILLVMLVVILASLNVYLLVKLQTQPVSQLPTVSPAPVIQTSPTLLPAEASAKEGDPTANWKTYRNDEYRFEIQYPGDLQSGTCPSNSAGLSCANGAKVFIGSLSLNIVTNSDTEGDKNGARFFFNGYFQGTKTKQSGFEDCFINNVKNSSAEISYVYCPNRPIFTAQIKGNGLEIYLLGSDWNGSNLVGITGQTQIDQILSTFKFLE